MTMPASSSPRASTPVPSEATRAVVWSSSPVSRAAAENAAPEHADQREGHQRAEHRGRRPGRQPVRQVQHREHDHAGADDRDRSGLRPARIAGSTNSSSTPKLDAERRQRGEPAPAAEDQHRRGEQRREPGQRAAALEVDELVGAGVVRVAARPAEHDGIAHREARACRARAGRAGRGRGPPAGRRSCATTSAAHRPCPSPGEQSAASAAVTWPRTGCCSAVPAVGGGPPVGRRRTRPTRAASAQGTQQRGEQHPDAAARRAAGRTVPVPVPVPDVRWRGSAARGRLGTTRHTGCPRWPVGSAAGRVVGRGRAVPRPTAPCPTAPRPRRAGCPVAVRRPPVAAPVPSPAARSPSASPVRERLQRAVGDGRRTAVASPPARPARRRRAVRAVSSWLRSSAGGMYSWWRCETRSVSTSSDASRCTNRTDGCPSRQQVPVAAAERGAGDDGAAPGGFLLADPRRDAAQPRPPVVVVQRRARRHLRPVRLGVEVVALLEDPAGALDERVRDRGLPHPGHPHHDEGQGDGTVCCVGHDGSVAHAVRPRRTGSRVLSSVRTCVRM